MHEGQAVAPPTPLPWYPDALAWQMTSSKKVVRKSPPFAQFQKFLVSETSVGNMSRQEAVSMIPPLLLDVRPDMAVLDLCAAPGSKAAQLLEMVHGGEEARMRKAARAIKETAGRQMSPDDAEISREIAEEEARQPDFPDDGRATGLLVANDMDYKRAYMLVHQLKRLNSANLIVTNHDATQYPSIRLPTPPRAGGRTAAPRALKFDRILADVPCSGDGTPRKNVNVWRDWNPGNALGLHPSQARILVRALQMLRVGGRVVYSTCSMNPVENEAVVAAAVARCGGSANVDIVDCANQLPDLKRRPGLSSWIVMDKSGTVRRSWEEVEAAREENVESGLEPEHGLGKLTPQLFPPAEDDEQPPLERCMRVYSHLQDTGAFFIAVLEKKKEIRARPEDPPKATATANEPAPGTGTAPVTSIVNEIEANTANGAEPLERVAAVDALVQNPNQPVQAEPPVLAEEHQDGVAPNGNTVAQKREADGAEVEDKTSSPSKRMKLQPAEVETQEAPTAAEPLAKPIMSSLTPRANLVAQKRKGAAPVEDPFKFLPPSHPTLTDIRSFYGLDDRFPADRFMVRNAAGEPTKAIYYTSALARDILVTNEGSGVRFVQCGVKMFVRQDVQRADVCRWRIQTEGLPLLDPWVGEPRVRRLRSRAVLREVLREMFPKVEGWGAKEGWGTFGDELRQSDMGCFVLRVEPGVGEDAVEDRLVLPLWKGLKSVNLMLPKEDRKAMLLRLFDEDVPLVDHSQKGKGKQNLAEVQEGDQEVASERAMRKNSSSDPDGAEVGAADDAAVDGSVVPDDADGAEDAAEMDVDGVEAEGSRGADESALANDARKEEADLKTELAKDMDSEGAASPP